MCAYGTGVCVMSGEMFKVERVLFFFFCLCVLCEDVSHNLSLALSVATALAMGDFDAVGIL